MFQRFQGSDYIERLRRVKILEVRHAKVEVWIPCMSLFDSGGGDIYAKVSGNRPLPKDKVEPMTTVATAIQDGTDIVRQETERLLEAIPVIRADTARDFAGFGPSFINAFVRGRHSYLPGFSKCTWPATAAGHFSSIVSCIEVSASIFGPDCSPYGRRSKSPAPLEALCENDGRLAPLLHASGMTSSYGAMLANEAHFTPRPEIPRFSSVHRIR
jgi:hypothetical protein